MAEAMAKDISKPIMELFEEKTKIITAEEGPSVATQEVNESEIVKRVKRALEYRLTGGLSQRESVPYFTDTYTIKFLINKSKSAKGPYTVFDTNAGKFTSASVRRPMTDIALLIRLFVMRGSNLKKIIQSLDPLAKKWLSESASIYGVVQQARGKERFITLKRLAQTFPHITTHYFKSGVANTFGDFPDDYPQVLKSTVLQFLDPDETLRPLAIVNNRKLANALERVATDEFVDKAYENKSDFYEDKDKIVMCKYLGLMDDDGNWVEWVLEWVNKISKEHGITGRGVKRGRDESKDEGSGDGDDAEMSVKRGRDESKNEGSGDDDDAEMSVKRGRDESKDEGSGDGDDAQAIKRQ